MWTPGVGPPGPDIDVDDGAIARHARHGAALDEVTSCAPRHARGESDGGERPSKQPHTENLTHLVSTVTKHLDAHDRRRDAGRLSRVRRQRVEASSALHAADVEMGKDVKYDDLSAAQRTEMGVAICRSGHPQRRCAPFADVAHVQSQAGGPHGFCALSCWRALGQGRRRVRDVEPHGARRRPLPPAAGRRDTRVTAAFLQGEELPAERVLYMRLPRRLSDDVVGLVRKLFGDGRRADLVRVKKGVFGLAESPRLWY